MIESGEHLWRCLLYVQEVGRMIDHRITVNLEQTDAEKSR